MSNAAVLKVELEEYLDKRKREEKELEGHKKQRTIALAGILFGILLIPAWGLGILLIIAGLLAYFTQLGKIKNANERIEWFDDKIRSLRMEIAKTES